MKDLVKIHNHSSIPKYKQLAGEISRLIEQGEISIGEKLPSINEFAGNLHIAKETVVKAFDILRSQGLISSFPGKGFYISSENVQKSEHIFLLFDTLSAYKEVTYHAIQKTLGNKGQVDIFFHHFNMEVFEQLIKEHLGKYTSYIVLPFDDKNITKPLNLIPAEKLYLLDRCPKDYKKDYCSVYQDFESDVYHTMLSTEQNMKKYTNFTLIFRNILTIPPKELVTGFKNFCQKHKIPHQVKNTPFQGRLKKGDSFLVIDDEDLVNIVLCANKNGFNIGQDVGIISYNDTPLKKVVGKGISVISTDFRKMGETIMHMVLNKSHDCIKNPCHFINRGSF